MKTVVVTGGAGFIGSNLVKFLIKKNYFVINIDKLSYSGNLYNLKNININKNYVFIKSDLNNRGKLIKIFKKFKPKGIFNLAAETHVDRSIDDPKDFIYSNILGTYNLLEAVLKYNKKIRIVHVSTDEVYGDLIKGRSKENFSYNPSSPYSSSKASADHLIKAYIRTYKLNAVISNCCNNYGPNQFPEKLIPKLIFNIINNKSLPIYAKGKNSREWMHVQDHCEALLLIYIKGKIGESYNIGSGKNLNNIQISENLLNVAKKYIKLQPKTKIIFVKDRPGHDFRYALNSYKIKKEIKWKPKTSFKEGLKKTFLWYLENKNYYKHLNKKDILKRLGNND